MNNFYAFLGDALKIGIEVIIASFDSISEVNMVSSLIIYTVEPRKPNDSKDELIGVR